MLFLKVIVFSLALFLSLLYLNNIIADLASLIMWGNSYHTEDDIKNRKDVGNSFAKLRLVLAVITSVLWGIFIVL